MPDILLRDFTGLFYESHNYVAFFITFFRQWRLKSTVVFSNNQNWRVEASLRCQKACHTRFQQQCISLLNVRC